MASEGNIAISVEDAMASETNSDIVFRVNSSVTATTAIAFEYEAKTDSSLTNSASVNDFEATSGAAIITAGSSSTTISIPISLDNESEPSEKFKLLLKNPSNAILGDNSAIGTILNYDIGEISNVTETIGGSQITFNWTNPSDSIFEGVTIAQAIGTTAPANCSGGNQLGKITSHDMTGLTNESTYSFRICARYSGNVHSEGIKRANITIIVVDSNENGLIDITNATQFNNIRHNLSGTSYKTSISAINNTNGCPANGCNGYELTANINLSSFTNWDPIGSSSDRFTAIFDGNNNTISGLIITGNDDYVGLFSATRNATIKNLKLTNVRIVGDSNIGALIGAANSSTLSSIELIGDDSQASDDAEIQTRGDRIGGLVGYFDGNGTIRNSSSSLTIRGSGAADALYIGGLVGHFSGGIIVNSSNSGSILVTDISCCAGGLVGFNRGTISQSWASGSVSGGGNNANSDAILGGLVGFNRGTISQSWASGSVSGGGNRVGGLVGSHGEGRIIQSWASGNVSGNNSIGGLVGTQTGGSINGRNYQLDNDGGTSVNIGAESFILANLEVLANLSGANGSYGTHSNWHIGFDNNLFTRFCDTNGNGTIDGSADGFLERTANNSVWVMSPASSDVPVPNVDIAGNLANYYPIPALRCIGTTPTERQANIDRQRRNFPRALPPRISIENVTGNEGSNLVFRVISNIPAIEQQFRFDYKIDFVGQNNPANSADLSSESTGRSIIAINSNSTTISIAIKDDNIRENAETFRLILSNPSPEDAIFTNTEAIGTIAANDTINGIKTNIGIEDAASIEGENIVFTVTSEQTITEEISFNYRVDFANPLTPNSANAADLNSGTSGIGIIAANGSSTTISIPIVDDIFKENSETFSIILSDLSLTGTIFTKSTAIGTIAPSDLTGVKTNFSISDASANEGNNIIFTVTANPAIAEQVSFDYRVSFTSQGNPARATDLSGQLTGIGAIAANNSSTTISIAVVADNIRENAETFNIILSALSDVGFTDNIGRGTILANEGNIAISVADSIASEASGDIVFRVNSSVTATTAIAFEYEATTDSSFTNSASVNDFEATSGTAIITAGSSSTTISIPIDLDNESDQSEKFRLLLKNPSNAVLDKIYAIGTILNYDLGEISDATKAINDSQITFNWTNPSDSIFEGVTIAQANGTTAPADCSGGNQLGKITSHDMTSLTNESTYSFRICARYSGNVHSDGVELANITLIVVDSNGNGLIDITNATQFNNIRYNLSGTSLTTSNAINNTIGCPASNCNGYELMNDITLNGQWTPFGSNSNRFTATFDGNNNTISNININNNVGNYMGLFSAIQNATIKNLKLTNVRIVGGSNVGALVGAANSSTLSNIELIGDANQTASNAEVIASGSHAGGLVGHFDGGMIAGASSSLTVRGGYSATSFLTSTSYTGGLVGYNRGTIRRSFVSGSVIASHGADFVGGLAGYNSNTISQSGASGNVSNIDGILSQSGYYGGLVGENEGNIKQSWASGNVTSSGYNNHYYGGLVGLNSNTIHQSWASGNVTSSGANSDYYGGLVGLNQGGTGYHTITQSWASGNVSSSRNNDKYGGLVGSRETGYNSMSGRNYQLGSDKNSNIVMGVHSLKLVDLKALANLSGASGIYRTHSNWHAGVNSDITTRYCDADNSGAIETNEQTANNSVWVMSPAPSDVAVPNVDIAGNIANYYAIPALRCIGTTPAERQANIDRQRRNFPRAIPPRISIENVTGNEGSNLVFKVISNIPVIEQISFDYKVVFDNPLTPSSASASDLSSDTTGKSTIAINSNSTTISIAIKDDNIKENAETFRLILSNISPENVIFTNTEAIGTIATNDIFYRAITNIRIEDAAGIEGENIVFIVTNEQIITEEISFNYRADFANPQNSNSANAADLSLDTSGRGIIAAGASSTTISIPIVDDIFKENNEIFSVILSDVSPTNANLADGTAIGTIATSDIGRVKTNISISNAEASEGNNLMFTVTVNLAIAEQVSFDYRVDFTGQENPASTADLSGQLTGKITIAANDSSTTISIAVVADNIIENDETFNIILSATSDIGFTDNIGIGTIWASEGNTVISVADATASETNSDIVFKVNSTNTATTAITFEYEATTDSSLTNPASVNDFEATSGTATIIAGDSSTTISIPIALDNESEQSEKFRLLLKNPRNAILAKIYAIGTILNYDLGEISNVTETIGDSQITFNWTNPSDSIFEGVTIAQANGTTAPANCSGGNQLGKITSHDMTGLTNESTYSFRICARYSGNVHSEGIERANITLIVVDSNRNGLIDITNATELNNIRHNLSGTSYKTSSSAINNTNGCPANGCNGYELTANINLSSFTNWAPIGSNSARFRDVTFDGNNNTISGLTITGNDDYVGLFSATRNATIKNLKLTNVSIVGHNNVGALAGFARSSNLSNIELIGDANQTVSNAEVRGSGGPFGGLVGEFVSGTIRNSSSSLTISGETGAYQVGGLVGRLLPGATIATSSNSGSVLIVDTQCCAGGLVGLNRGTISQSWSSGSVSGGGMNPNSDGILGGLVSINEGDIRNSWASGNVTSVGNFIGGLVGRHLGAKMYQSWASGVVTGVGPSLGGLIGSSGTRQVGGNVIQSIISGSYRLDSKIGGNVSANNSIQLDINGLVGLSGAAADSNWHAGINNDLVTRFCDTNGNNIIDGSADGLLERTANNSVWVMGPAASDNVPAPTTNEAGGNQNYHAIPALRCIGDTKGKTTTEINDIRKANIDRQRRLFPRP